MALFEHFIVTRFNLPLFKAKVEGKVVGNLDETWLAGRFDLFERYCLPSVKGQTCQNFRWIVLFDAATPQKFKDRFKSYCDGYDRLIPCYIDCSFIPDSDEELCPALAARNKRPYVRYARWKPSHGHADMSPEGGQSMST